MQDVFIIGAKGIGNYGGYETFLKKLIETDKENKQIKYHVACKYNGQSAMDETKLLGAKTIDDHHFTYYNADCFKIDISEKLGPAQAIYYDIAAFKECIRQIKEQNISHPIVYVLACRIGPFISKYVKQLHQLGGQLFVNPDGHEWMRAKWSKPVRRYWKLSEAGMVKHADLLVCDSVNIEKYIQTTYTKYQPKTTYIAYGADVTASNLTADSEKVRTWYAEKGLKENDYFLVVGRFVPENNYATMIAEFMKSTVKKDLVLITNVEHNKFYDELKKETGFDKDPRIKFVGTVYDGDLLKYIRENAFAYLHGHSVGGTNPSLLEALSSTKINLLYNIGFNKEVGQDAALYWDKSKGKLSKVLEETEYMNENRINEMAKKAQKIIRGNYSWKFITSKYNKIFEREDK